MMTIELKNVTTEQYFGIANEYNGKVYLYVFIGGAITTCRGIDNLKVGDAFRGKIDFSHGKLKMVEYERIQHVSIRKNNKPKNGCKSQSEFQAIDDYLVKVKRRLVLEGIEPGSQEWEKAKDEAAELFATVNNCEKHVSKDTYIWKKFYNDLYNKKND